MIKMTRTRNWGKNELISRMNINDIRKEQCK